jgi:hypothetical protein
MGLWGSLGVLTFNLAKFYRHTVAIMTQIGIEIDEPSGIVDYDKKVDYAPELNSHL